MRARLLGAVTFVSCLAATLSHTSTAAACGGCFHGPNESTPSVVTGHRMALAVSPVRTVLWDQVQYAGDPKDFAWVLPVGPGAYIEAASAAWFESLEAVTAAHVMSPVVTCPGGQTIQASDGGGFGCGAGPVGIVDQSSAPPDEKHRDGAVDGVTVEHEGTVGPYETVTLKASDPNALRNWLTSHQYAIPDDIQPVIDAYVAQKSDFIALRLSPGQGIRQMTPVRVITPGAAPTLPLRMVAAGTGADVSIVLYVIAEGTYRASNFPNTTINFSQLSWDWTQRQSNFATLRNNALVGGGFLTSFALNGGLTARVVMTDGNLANYTVTGATSTYNNLTDLYFAQAAADEAMASGGGPAKDCSGVSALLDSTKAAQQVVECADERTCLRGIFPDGLSARNLECDGFTDIATALVGMHPRDVWVTRLEADLPRSALGKDLELAAPIDQSKAANWHQAALSVGSPCPPAAPQPAAADPAPQSQGGCSVRRPVFSNTAVVSLAAFALLFGVRRASSRRRGRG